MGQVARSLVSVPADFRQISAHQHADAIDKLEMLAEQEEAAWDRLQTKRERNGRSFSEVVCSNKIQRQHDRRERNRQRRQERALTEA